MQISLTGSLHQGRQSLLGAFSLWRWCANIIECSMGREKRG